MDKNAIKKYAVWARRELISRVSQRAALYGITDKGFGEANADSVNGKVLSAAEKKERQALIAQIRSKGYEEVMEEVAYTWFNRFSALRFMEVNGYLPSHVRVFTDDENAFKPQILTEAINLEIDGIDMEKVYALKNANDNDELFKYLIIVQCNALSEILPGMFQRIADYTELLFPDNLLRAGSAVEQMIALIPQEDWKDAVQIIGWLYQYYNTEKKDDVFAALKKNVKITKENIPAATQLFTPDWIVRYMVENSLGRLWLEGHPNDDLKSEWKYYLDEAEQELQVQSQLAAIRKDYAALTPEQIKCIDPCSGSGHICAYMFDVLMQIYEAYGYTAREAVASIVENNIYGLDIDERAAQLAYFAVMMKARQYDRRFFSRGIQPHVYAIQESNSLDSYAVEYFCDSRHELKSAMKTLMDELHDAKEYGSILNVPQVDFAALYARLDEINEDISIYRDAALNQLTPFIQCAEAMAQKYHAVVTNPPYMGGSGMSTKLSDFVKKNYPDSKSDLFAVFIEHSFQMLKKNGYSSMITMESWMFLSSFEKMRISMLNVKTITSLIHMPYLGKGGTSLGINFGTEMAVIQNCRVPKYNGTYDRIAYYETDDDGVPFEFPTANGYYRHTTQDNFFKIPGSPVAYWVSDATISAFTESLLSDYGETKQGFATGDNNRFLRFWSEVNFKNVLLSCKSHSESKNSIQTWYPCNKGGAFRRWYGNNIYLANWQYDGIEMRGFKGSVIRNPQYYFNKGITWSSLSSGGLSMRYSPEGFIFESKGSMCYFFDNDNLLYILGLMNSKVIDSMLLILSPTIDYHEGPMSRVPVIVKKQQKAIVEKIVDENVNLCRLDWDAYESSWDFRGHPLVRHVALLSDAFSQWETECNDRFNQLKANEEELNRIFIDIYGLQNELNPAVEDKDVTVRKADLQRDIKSLISYAVGCMFGRYSLDTDGLTYAGGEWDGSKYKTILPDKDAILPICDDEYFADDIVGRFVEFVRAVYGADTLDENLKFIADALGGKGQPKEVIRNYFLNDFYADHLKIYQKRPIYWQFDSGKKNGFKALIYMHRYQPDTIARVRTDYVHEQQSRYRTAISDLEDRIASASTSDRVKLTKKLKTLQDQAEEIRVYEEKIHHLADQMIAIDLDDGVKVNYEKFADVLAKIK